MSHDNISTPWYKQFWAWFVIAILAFAVFIGLGLLFVATMNHASLDHAVSLRQIKGNTYTGQLEQKIEGRRYIELSDPDKPGDQGWRLTGEVHLAPGQPYQITAQ